jgi:LacI family transcriptional regulator
VPEDEIGATLGAYTRHADFRVEGGRAAMTELIALNEPPDAVLESTAGPG